MTNKNKKNKQNNNNNNNTNQKPNSTSTSSSTNNKKNTDNNKQQHHHRTKSLDEETQTHGRGKLSHKINTSNVLGADDSSPSFGSPTTSNIDFSGTFASPNLLSAKEVPIFDLIAAVIVRIVTSKRFWTFILLIAIYSAHYNQNELREVGMRYYPKGLQIEEDDRPGLRFNASRIKVQRPVVIIPGFVTTGLELWAGQDCILSDVSTNFRQRMFGTSMIMKLLQNPACYLRHIALHPESGGDPHPKIKVRHDTGLDSVDYIDRAGMYWVWAKLMRNLADIGYEPKNLHVAGYDWRLDPELTEERYAYFSRLKRKIEGLYEASGTTTSRFDCLENETDGEKIIPASPSGRHEQEKQRVVIIFHSYGGIMTREFLNFCDKKEPGWTDKYIASIVGNGGAHLGIPKANAALTSGEMKDTATLPTVPRRIFDSHVLRRTRANAFRTWACLHAMMTRGPEKLFPEMLEFTSQLSTSSETSLSFSSLTSGGSSSETSLFTSWAESADSVDALEQYARATGEQALSRLAWLGTAAYAKEEDPKQKSRGWKNSNTNDNKKNNNNNNNNNKNPKEEKSTSTSTKEGGVTPFEGKKLGTKDTMELIRQVAIATNNTRLVKHIERTKEIRNEVPQFPKAKKTSLFCVYGVGLDTEVGYYYKQPQRKKAFEEKDEKLKQKQQGGKRTNPKDLLKHKDEELIEEYDLESIEFDFDTPSGAVRVGDGDGTVPLVSLGYPCRSKKNGFPRSFKKVTTVEMRHDPAPLDPRGGIHSGDHVDGLGNWDFIEVALKVVSGLEDEVEENILSDIDERVKEIDG